MSLRPAQNMSLGRWLLVACFPSVKNHNVSGPHLFPSFTTCQKNPFATSRTVLQVSYSEQKNHFAISRNYERCSSYLESSVVGGRNRIWRRFRVFCLLSVKVCSWYKTHSNTGILAGVRYVFFFSVPGFQFGPVTVSFEAFSGHKTMMYTLKVGFTIVHNLIQHRGLDCHLILQTVSRN